jgi:hypothetical protein
VKLKSRQPAWSEAVAANGDAFPAAKSASAV